LSWTKLAAIGNWSTVFPLKAIGIDVHPIEKPDDAPKILRKLAHSKEFGIIFVEEAFLDLVHDVLDEFADSELPSVILIPSVAGSQGLGTSIIRDTMKKAAGRDIMAEDD